jgi:hypothetical protein
MADRKQDLLGRLADLSEDAIQRLAEAPGADRVFGAVNGLRDRVDELQKRTRAIDGLEKRLETLEKRVDALAKTKTATRPRSSTGPRASTPKRSTPPKKT